MEQDNDDGGEGGGGGPENPFVPDGLPPSNPFDLLPDDALIHLLTFFDLTDPANHGVLDVCTRFRRLCQSRRTKLVFLSLETEEDVGGMSERVARTLLSHCPRLRELEFVSDGICLGIWRGSGPLSIHALQHCQNLTSLKGVYCGGDARLTKDFLMTVGEHGRALVELELRETDFSQVRSSEQIAGLKGLRIISFPGCMRLSDDLLRAMGDTCRNVTDFSLNIYRSREEKSGKDAECHFLHGIRATIERLNLRYYEPCSEFFGILEECQNLEVLSVNSAERLDRNGLMSISSLPRLRSLAIGNLTISNTALFDAFGGRKMAKLVHLDLSHFFKLEDAALTFVAENCPDLEELILRSCDKLTEVGIRSVVTKCRKLRRLELGNSGLEDAALTFVAENCPDLEELSLSSCVKLTEVGIRSVVTKCKKLKRLELDHSGLEDAALILVAENCPDLEVLDLKHCFDLTDVGIRSVVIHCGKLRRLELTGIHGVSRPTLEDVRTRLPDLEYLGEPVYEDEEAAYYDLWGDEDELLE